MNRNYLLRLAIAALVVLVCVLVLGGLLLLTQVALNVFDRLADAPAAVRFGFWVLVMAIASGFLWLAVVLAWPTKRKSVASPELPRDHSELEARVAAAQQRGVDVGEAQAELDRLQDYGGGTVSVALLGEISVGKSSLVKALVPSARVEVGVLGGTTQAVRRYHWDSDQGDRITLVDLPGLGMDADAATLEEAQRCHVLVYMSEADLTRQEFDALEHYLKLEKPTVVAINKSDQYSADALMEVKARLQQRLAALDRKAVPVVAVVSGGAEQLIEVVDGNERTVTRPRSPEVWALSEALGEVLAADGNIVEQLRDRAVFALAHNKLLAAEASYRRSEAGAVVKSYTRKAILGALAAISPGTDLLIQGYLATAMVRSLCRLYGIAPKDIDIEQFLDLAQGQLGKSIPLLLAVAGNGLKAFPGAGTLAGGLVHAVAYGLVFDSLGRGLKTALEEHGQFGPQQAAEEFKETLDGDLQVRALEVAKMALAHRPNLCKHTSPDT
jgi:GTP-binding protein EngB required for normal cell division